jgi:hypothetical protein
VQRAIDLHALLAALLPSTSAGARSSELESASVVAA